MLHKVDQIEFLQFLQLAILAAEGVFGLLKSRSITKRLASDFLEIQRKIAELEKDLSEKGER